jgi:Na+-driven multidrug efflux pump
MLRINAIFYGFVSLNVVIYYILRIGGDVKASFVMETGYVWLFLLPVAALLALVSKVDILTFYVLVQATELVKLFLGRHYIKKERWVRNLT